MRSRRQLKIIHMFPNMWKSRIINQLENIKPTTE